MVNCLHSLASNSNHYVFQDTPNCDVINGTLYSCLRALFGVSVFGILLCIFTSMLVYQIMNHEKKKKFLEQIQTRRRCQYQALRRGNVDTACYSQPFLSFPFHFQNYGYLDENYYPASWILPSYSNWDSFSYSYTNYLENETDPSYCNRDNMSENSTLLARLGSRSVNFFRHIFHRRTRDHNSFNNSTSPSLQPLPPRYFSSGSYIPPPHSSHYRITIPSHSAFTPFNARRHRLNDGLMHQFPQLSLINPQMNNLYFNSPQIMNSSQALYASWGPPPPYSQRQSLENIHHTRAVDNRSNHHSRPSSIHSTNEVITNNTSSKLSSPLSERRKLCNISSDGITLTIGRNSSEPSKSKNSCRVQVHVGPKQSFSSPNSQVAVISTDYAKTAFNTLPSLKKEDLSFNSYKSLSDIPINFDSKLDPSPPTVMSLEKLFTKQSYSFQASLDLKKAKLTKSKSKSDCDVTEKVILTDSRMSSSSSQVDQKHLKSVNNETDDLNESVQKLLTNSSSSLKKTKSKATSIDISYDVLKKEDNPILSLSQTDGKANPSQFMESVNLVQQMPKLNNKLLKATSLESTKTTSQLTSEPSVITLPVQQSKTSNPESGLNDNRLKKGNKLSKQKSQDANHLIDLTSSAENNEPASMQLADNQGDNIVVTIRSIQI